MTMTLQGDGWDASYKGLPPGCWISDKTNLSKRPCLSPCWDDKSPRQGWKLDFVTLPG